MTRPGPLNSNEGNQREEAPSPTNILRRRIREDLDIVAVIRDYTPLRADGDLFRGRCPFHADAGEALEVCPKRRLFRCPACGTHGDLTSFFQLLDRMDQTTVTRQLAELAGVSQ